MLGGYAGLASHPRGITVLITSPWKLEMGVVLWQRGQRLTA